MAHSPEAIRNLALVGHSSSGKTALIDALAFLTNATPRHGNTADGSSISDTEPEEQERQHTLTSHLFSFDWDKTALNIVDTPGHSDFQGDVYATLPLVEAALLCVSSTSGLTFHGRKLFTDAAQAGVGRAVVVTHPDGENAHFDETLAALNEALGDTVVPVTYPDGDGEAFTCVHDVLHGDGPMAAEYRAILEERVAEADDEVLERYLETGELSEEDFEKYLPAAIAREKVTPLFTVCPPKELGLRKLASFVAHYFPSPIAFGARQAGDEVILPTTDGQFFAQVFKVVQDPYVGTRCFVRCLRGKVKPDGQVWNTRTGSPVKLTGLQTVHGAELEDIDEIVPGDVFVVAKVDDLRLDDTLSSEEIDETHVNGTSYPLPTYSLAVQPKARGDEQKINEALEKLAAEDPTFGVSRDANTGELVISGSSPLHLEVQLDRLLRRYGVQTEQHAPAVPYKETIATAAEGSHKHKKQSGGRGQFAEVHLRIRPLERGEGFRFVDKVVGGAVPRQFIPEIEKGVKTVMAKGVIAGRPVEDVEVEVYDGKFHAVDSDQLSFQLAGGRAFLDAFNQAKPMLLEPIVDVTVSVPDRFTGDVASNLSTLRGRLTGMEPDDGLQVLSAQVPLKEMQEYATLLRSITAGEGSFSMRPSHFEPVPPNIQAQIVKAEAPVSEAG